MIAVIQRRPNGADNGQYYYALEYSEFNNYSGITGTATDPKNSYLPGNAGNNYEDDHILAYLEELELTVPNGETTCADVQNERWMQTGVGMGILHDGPSSGGP